MVFMNNENLIIKQTQKWLKDVIIKHSICPFAKHEFDKHSIHYEVIESTDLQSQLEQLILQCEILDREDKRETTLLLFPNSLTDFEDYLDALEIATKLLLKQGYEGIYQLASFHPKYVFAETAINDPSNYTNRSPYPMLHILREASIEKRLSSHPNPKSIPERNIQLTERLGLKTMQTLLSDCY